MYSVTLDGTTKYASGQPVVANTNMFQTLLFSQTGLDNTQHQLQLQNKYSTSVPAWVDVDFIVVTSGDGNAG
jgi:hypothetical protein